MTPITRPGGTPLPRRFEAIDVRITRWLARYGIVITRLGLGRKSAPFSVTQLTWHT